jgi:hypothetical protein
MVLVSATNLQREDTRIWHLAVLLGAYRDKGGGPYTMARTLSGHLTARGDVRVTAHTRRRSGAGRVLG